MKSQERIIATFMGMSQVGKTYWSKQLQNIGFDVFHCDDLIEEGLGSEFRRLGYFGTNGMGRWMGQPFHPRYPRRSRQYLDLEEEVTRETLGKALQLGKDRNVVIDTTGSVIYLPDEILKDLAAKTRVVYLCAPDSAKQRLLDLYIKEPKPVFWGNAFNRKEGEDNMQALVRCYPELLEYRAGEYAKYAHVTLDSEELRKPRFTLDDFIAAAF